MNKVFSFIALAFLGCGSAAAQQAIFLENLCKLFTISKRKIVPLHNDNDSAIKELLQSRRKKG